MASAHKVSKKLDELSLNWAQKEDLPVRWFETSHSSCQKTMHVAVVTFAFLLWPISAERGHASQGVIAFDEVTTFNEASLKGCRKEGTCNLAAYNPKKRIKIWGFPPFFRRVEEFDEFGKFKPWLIWYISERFCHVSATFLLFRTVWHTQIGQA